MRLLGPYFHVYVFAAFFIGFAVAVANDPVAFEKRVRPVAHEAVAVTGVVENYLKRSALWTVAEGTAELLVTTVRLPVTLMEKVSDALQDVRKKSARRASLQDSLSTPSRQAPSATAWA